MILSGLKQGDNAIFLCPVIKQDQKSTRCGKYILPIFCSM